MDNPDTDRLLQRFTVDAWNRGDFSGFDDTIAEDYVIDPGMAADHVKQVIRAYREAVPDLTLTVLETVTEGDRVAYRWEITGTHQGEYRGVAPTGRRIAATGITMLQLRDGKVVRDRFESSSTPLEQQLTAAEG